ncbi:hypothetical protein KA012_02240 [Candidatus Woesebacteria bacterium]|nr:hypothetical protein [Candidatus Woesebacteria bacterium]
MKSSVVSSESDVHAGVIDELLVAAKSELTPERFGSAQQLMDTLRSVLDGKCDEGLVEIEALLAKIDAILVLNESIPTGHLAVLRALFAQARSVIVDKELPPGRLRVRQAPKETQSEVERRSEFEKELHAALDGCRVNRLVDPDLLTILLLDNGQSAFGYPLRPLVLERLSKIRDEIRSNSNTIWQLPTKQVNITNLLRRGIWTLEQLRHSLEELKQDSTWSTIKFPENSLRQIEAALAQISQE